MLTHPFTYLKYYSSAIILVFLFSLQNAAIAGDTIEVQTFTFGSPQHDTFLFPPDSIQFEKVLMYYTLKCNPAQNPACGEWDYLTYTFLYHHTGLYDSLLKSHPNFILGGMSPDSINLAFQPAWQFKPYFEYHIIYTDTLSQIAVQSGSGSSSMMAPFAGNKQQAKTYFLYKASDLQAAGLTAGNITNLQLQIATTGSNLNHLSIHMTNSTLDSVYAGMPSPTNLTEVYNQNTSFAQVGWRTFDFTTPFNWDGNSNILVQWCFDNPAGGTATLVTDTSVNYAANLEFSGREYALSFHDEDHVDVPDSVFSTIDSAITIEFWQYGDPNLQPQSDAIFEGLDSAGNRVVNAHLPWGNSRVYWDAGNSGSTYDRIDQAANPADFMGQWNHWAFTKDVASGLMKIYLNGQLWHSGTGKSLSMAGIKKFTIGSGANLNMFYDGMIDEFRIWDKVLSQNEIQTWMNKKLDNNHPEWASLRAYYPFNDGISNCAADFSDNAFLANLYGAPEWVHIQSCDQFISDASGSGYSRPNTIFEKNTYTSSIDSTLMIDSIQQNQWMVVLFDDTSQPTLATDTLWAWPSWYRYSYDNAGQIIDSSIGGLDSTIYHIDHFYYDPPFEIIPRYELGRFITPYGINLSLGDGFTWVYDVSDFRTLLADSVELSAGNWQELMDMKFLMIKGTPPRNVKDIRNVWSGGHAYNAAIENEFLYPKTFDIPADVSQARLRINITGHGFGGNLNCSEFCPRVNTVKVNNQFFALQNMWRDDCDLNPVFPQGGTWIYDRANWCPGAEVRPYFYEISNKITPGDSVSVDFDMQPGYVWNGQGSQPYYRIDAQLVTYGAPNFQNDAAISDIIAPNDADFWKRYNPICNNAVIKIKNTGSNPLTSLDIAYGPQGGDQANYHWTGNLDFLEESTIDLPAASWGSWTGPDIFEASISNPNGQTDDYADNNTMHTNFQRTPLYENEMVFWLRTNASGFETSYQLKDINGNIIYSRSNCSNNTIYKDTFQLADGCYTLTIFDSGEDGLYFFANNDGSGYAKLRKTSGAMIKNFKADFGSKISQQFTVGFPLGVELNQWESFMELYPNPSSGIFQCDINLNQPDDINLYLTDLMGRIIEHKKLRQFSHGVIPIDMSERASGVYLVIVQAGSGIMTKKLIVQHE